MDGQCLPKNQCHGGGKWKVKDLHHTDRHDFSREALSHMPIELRRIHSIAAEIEHELIDSALELDAHEGRELGVVRFAVHTHGRREVETCKREGGIVKELGMNVVHFLYRRSSISHTTKEAARGESASQPHREDSGWRCCRRVSNCPRHTSMRCKIVWSVCVAERNTDCMGRMRLVLLEEESKHCKEGSDVEGISKAVQVMVLAPAMARVWILKR